MHNIQNVNCDTKTYNVSGEVKKVGFLYVIKIKYQLKIECYNYKIF